jgi:hypothetical protein
MTDLTHYAYLAGTDLDGNDVYVIDILSDDGKTLSGVWSGGTEAEMKEAAKFWLADGCTVHFSEPPAWIDPG